MCVLCMHFAVLKHRDPLFCMFLTCFFSHARTAHTRTPCLRLYALCSWPLFLFAGRAKAEPARQTTTKRRKRKNSNSSANSSVGTAAGKKRSPATNFSLSSQVPVSISSSRFASFIYFLLIFSHLAITFIQSSFQRSFNCFVYLHSTVCGVTNKHQKLLMGSQLLKFNLFARMEERGSGRKRVENTEMCVWWDEETSGDFCKSKKKRVTQMTL